MSVTYEEILVLFREVAEARKETERLMRAQSQETERRFQETERQFQEVAEARKETERQFQEAAEARKETERRFQETERQFQEVAEARKETERQFQEAAEARKETERRFQETDRLIKALSKNLGDIGNRLGEFVEHMVMPTVVHLFQTQGLEVHAVHSDISAKRDGRGIQIDLLIVNDGVAIAVECKSKMTTTYVDEHVQRMDKFKQLLPVYRHHRIFGAVAALVMPDEIAEYAEQQGFYVLMQSGDTLTISNQPAFCARAW